MEGKCTVINKIINSGIVAVIRSKSKNEAEKVTRACIDGGVNIIEITFSVPDADEVIKILKHKFNKEVVIGAGTVLDVVTARLAILAGAQFIVAPTFDKEIALLCNMYNVAYVPGCMTINEMVEAKKYGVDIIKLFPGEQFNTGYIKSIKAPLPQIDIMVTGGVNIDNIDKWIKAGVVAVGVGGNLTTVHNENYDEITQIARKYIKKIEFARGI